MDARAKFLPALGRVFLALIFVLSGLRKLGSIGTTAAQMANHGIPYSSLLVWGAVALELGGGLMLMSGLVTRWVALALCLYTLALAVIFHAYWALPPAEAVRRSPADETCSPAPSTAAVEATPIPACRSLRAAR